MVPFWASCWPSSDLPLSSSHEEPTMTTEVTAMLPPRTFANWCVYALVLLMPGSFEVLALLWLYRRLRGAFADRYSR